ncbi:MAG: NUDIX domain-containing protein [Alphaproteobacteria bacterium]|nr:NUDIX domain-containing protein [Alphaproteobacteria bacterium]
MSDRNYPDRPYVGVGVVVLHADQVLLVRRGKPPRAGAWSIPGGAQNVGETVRDAAKREVFEETGVEVELFDLLDVVDTIRHDGEGRVQFHFTLVDFLGEWRSGALLAGDDAADCRWVPLGDIERYGMWNETERMIRLAVSRLALRLGGS